MGGSSYKLYNSGDWSWKLSEDVIIRPDESVDLSDDLSFELLAPQSEIVYNIKYNRRKQR
jgi:hypothetical protein